MTNSKITATTCRGTTKVQVIIETGWKADTSTGLGDVALGKLVPCGSLCMVERYNGKYSIGEGFSDDAEIRAEYSNL